MLGFIQLTRPDGTPVLINVWQIVDVWEPIKLPRCPAGDAETIHCGISMANQVDSTSSEAWYVREHYPAVLALLVMAGAKVVK